MRLSYLISIAAFLVVAFGNEHPPTVDSVQQSLRAIGDRIKVFHQQIDKWDYRRPISEVANWDYIILEIEKATRHTLNLPSRPLHHVNCRTLRWAAVTMAQDYIPAMRKLRTKLPMISQNPLEKSTLRIKMDKFLQAVIALESAVLTNVPRKEDWDVKEPFEGIRWAHKKTQEMAGMF